MRAESTRFLLAVALMLGCVGCASAGAPLVVSLSVVLAALLTACGGGPDPSASRHARVERPPVVLTPIEADAPVVASPTPSPAEVLEPATDVEKPPPPRVRPRPPASRRAPTPRSVFGARPSETECDGEWVQTGRMLRAGPRWVCQPDRVRVRIAGARR